MSNNKKFNKEFTSVFCDYAQNILKHIYFRVSNPELAEDIMQEAFLKTWKYVLFKKKQIRGLKSFLYMVVNNLIIDYYRNKDRSPLSIEEIKVEKLFSTDPGQEDEVDKSIGLEICKKHIAELKGGYREIIIFRYFNEMSIQEISEITNKSPNYVSVIIHRGVKILREKARDQPGIREKEKKF